MYDFDLFHVNKTYLLPCSVCGTETNHKMTDSGALVCWCGTEFIDEGEIERTQEYMSVFTGGEE